MNNTQEDLIRTIKILGQQNANLSVDNALLQAQLESAYKMIEELQAQNQEKTE